VLFGYIFGAVDLPAVSVLIIIIYMNLSSQCHQLLLNQYSHPQTVQQQFPVEAKAGVHLIDPLPVVPFLAHCITCTTGYTGAILFADRVGRRY